MENSTKVGLNNDLLLHHFCHLYSTQIDPELKKITKSFANEFEIVTIPHVQISYPTVYSQITIQPLFKSNARIEIKIFPNPSSEAIEIQVENKSNGNILHHNEKIAYSDWGSLKLNNILVTELYYTFYKKNALAA